MQIGESARKHGLADEAMRHAVRVPFRIVRLGDDRTLYIGADPSGTLLEVVVAGLEGDAPRIIHAMNLRRKFYQYL